MPKCNGSVVNIKEEEEVIHLYPQVKCHNQYLHLRGGVGELLKQ